MAAEATGPGAYDAYRPPVAARPSGFRRAGRRIAPYLFLLPFFLLFACFLVLPLVYAFRMSLFRETLIAGEQFVGAANYLKAVADPRLWDGVGNLLIFGAVHIPIMLGLALFSAIVLDSGRVPAKGLFRIAIFLPYAVPSVIAALIWGYLYGPVFGPFAQLAEMTGGAPPAFLTPGSALYSIANIVTWEFVGYNMIIYYGALKAMPTDLAEAARMDGATPWQFARTVTVPLLAPTILVTVLFSINGTLQLFNEPILMRPLAPSVIGSSYTPNIYAYSLATVGQQYGYAAAISFVLGGVIILITVAVLLLAALLRRGR